jgi:small subunit ribosomal protein S9
MKIIHASGKRKTAIARATLKEGNGSVRINGKSLEFIEPEMFKHKISEPLILSGIGDKLSISVKVSGGGMASQAEAVRLAIGRTLINYNESLKEVLESYDRQLLVADIRRKETRKPNRHGKARAKVQKSYR